MEGQPTLESYALSNPGGNADAAELLKSLTAGHLTGRETTNRTDVSGAGLKVESLDKMLKTLTYKEADIIFWRKVPKKTAYNTVEEYVQQTSYGVAGGAFMGEGGLPRSNDPAYVRRAELIKYMGVTMSVSHQMQLTNQIGGTAMQKASQAGTMHLMKEADRALFYANDEADPLEFNGLYAQHERNSEYAGNFDAYQDGPLVIDLRGDYLKPGHLEDGALGIVNHHGSPNYFLSAPSVLNDFAKTTYDTARVNLNAQSQEITVGNQITAFASQFGRIPLQYDKFAAAAPFKYLNSPADRPEVPQKPIADGVAPATAVADANGRFTGQAGDYLYAVVAKNNAGESQLTLLTAARLAVAGGQSVDLKFTDGGAGSTNLGTTSYRIYRSEKNPVGDVTKVPFYPIFTVNVQKLGGGYDGGLAGTVRDRNRFIANTEQAAMLEFSNEVLEYAQLLPMMRMPLAQIDTSSRFALLLYGSLLMYNPGKAVRFINIGKRKE